jgi:hypothetical protein
VPRDVAPRDVLGDVTTHATTRVGASSKPSVALWKVARDERNRRKWSQAVINYSATTVAVSHGQLHRSQPGAHEDQTDQCDDDRGDHVLVVL